jgi:peptidoglycan hydrolase-like protein with peptidoglycan-binding domain
VPKLIEHPNLFQPNQVSQQTNDASGSRTEDAALSAEKRGANTDSSSKAATDESTELAGPLNTEPTNEGDHAIGTTTSEDARSHAIDPSMTSNTWGPAGTKNHSTAPLRVLITRRTKRDHIIGVQHMLSSLGYLKPQKFTGRLEEETVTAIKAFQKANGMPETGVFTDLAKKIYEVAGKEEPPEGHLFVRQDFRRVFDVPVTLRNPDQPLGTHIYIAMKFELGDATAKWMAISIGGGHPASVLDRVEIPSEAREKISERLTPGSSLIIADKSVNSAILAEGDDFSVAAKDTTTGTPKARQTATKHAQAKKAKVKHAKAAPKATKPRTAGRIARKRERLAWRYYAYEPPRRFRPQRVFSRW